MWIKKSQDEIKKERKKNIKYRTIFIWLFLIFLICVTHKIGLRLTHFDQSINPIPWDQFWKDFLYILGFSPIGFICIYLYQKNKIYKYGSFNGLLCIKCGTSKVNDSNYNCECGGIYYILDELKWINDPCPENKLLKENNKIKNESSFYEPSLSGAILFVLFYLLISVLMTLYLSKNINKIF